MFSLLKKSSETGSGDKNKMLNEVLDKHPLEQKINTESYLIALLFKVSVDKAQKQ